MRANNSSAAMSHVVSCDRFLLSFLAAFQLCPFLHRPRTFFCLLRPYSSHSPTLLTHIYAHTNKTHKQPTLWSQRAPTNISEGSPLAEPTSMPFTPHEVPFLNGLVFHLPCLHASAPISMPVPYRCGRWGCVPPVMIQHISNGSTNRSNQTRQLIKAWNQFGRQVIFLFLRIQLLIKYWIKRGEER